MKNAENLPLVTVAISAYNHEDFIKECIESIWEQDYPNIEILVIDDNSKDNTYQILKELEKKSPYKMEVFRNEENKGISKNLNRLIKIAKGEFISFMSSDDKYYGKKVFSSCIEIFLENPEVQVIYNEGYTWDGKNFLKKAQGSLEISYIKNHQYEKLLEHMLSNVPHLLIQGSFFRKKFLEEIGGFDETLRADDWVLNIRVFKAIISNISNKNYKALYNENIGFLYRQHESNTIRNRDYLLKLVEEVIDSYVSENKRNCLKGRVYWRYGLYNIKTKKLKKGIIYLIKTMSICPTEGFKETYKKIKERFFSQLENKFGNDEKFS